MAAIAEVIKYEGDNSTFIWKHPLEDFNSLTQLIVHESQEAIFFMNGQALDTFGSGRYTLETENVPKIGKFLGRNTTPETPFHAEVYFINMATQMGLKWGTDTKIRILEPTSMMPIDLGASGEFNIRVTDSRKMLLKLVGTTNGLTQSDLISGTDGKGMFRTMIVTQVKSYLAETIKEQKINVLEIDSKLAELSEALKTKINDYLQNYGLIMPEFFVARIVTPDDDPNFKRFKEQYSTEYLSVRQEEIRKKIAEAEAERRSVEAETEAKLKKIGAMGEADAMRIKKQAEADAYRMKAEAEAMEMKMKGYTYQQETSRMMGMQALKDGIPVGGGSGTPGGSGIAGTMLNGVGEIAGLGMTLGALGGVMGMAKDAISPMMDIGKDMTATVSGAINQNRINNTCPKCGAVILDGAKFCLQCGSKVEPAVPDNMVICPSCGKIVSKGKFCLECGYKFVSVCPKCGKELNEGSKFCPECGERL